VAVLEQVGDFKSVTSYLPDVAAENLVSLTMPVRTESYTWDDQLPPILQMNLPEGYLLQVLQEEFGPVVGASPTALLSVIGRNMVGRLQVAPPEASLDEPAKPIEVAELLKGDNSEEAFSELVRENCCPSSPSSASKSPSPKPECPARSMTCGVSGVALEAECLCAGNARRRSGAGRRF